VHQVVVARSPLVRLLATIGQLTSPLQNVPAGQQTIHRRNDGEPILAGEINGLSYLFEDHATVFALCWGLLSRVSRELGSLVVGSCFDPLEDQCELFLADRGQVLRAWRSNPRRTLRPYSLGAPLESEANVSLSAAGGAGLKAALRAFGFPLLDREWFDADCMVVWPGDSCALLEADDLCKPVGDHARAWANPAYQPPVPKVTVRWEH
jgi:hypothetical protein